MNKVLTITVMLLLCCQLTTLSAQITQKLTVAGGSLVVTENTRLVLEDTNLQVDGSLSTEEGSVIIFSGTESDTVSLNGTTTLNLEEISLNRSGAGLRLDQNTNINKAVNLSAGVLELNGKTLTLAEGATLENESADSYVVGTQGGVLSTTANYTSALTEANPGNLGLTISTETVLSNTIITRGNVAQIIGNESSLLRYYELTPTNNSGLNATVKIEYFDHELNGVEEAIAMLAQEDTDLTLHDPIARDTGLNYLEVAGLDKLNLLTVVTGAVRLNPTLVLEGADDTTLTGIAMRDDLRSTGLIPLTEQYTDLGYIVTEGGQTVNQSVLDITGSTAVVDWVLLELRDVSDNSILLHSRPALLRADGAVVDTDGTSNVLWRGILSDTYYLSIQHRNHLGVMSNQALSLTKTTLDWDTTDSNNLFGGVNAAKDDGNGVWMLVGGDADFNGQVQNADYNSILVNIGSSGYLQGDLDMNGQVQNTDMQNILLPNVGRGEQN